MEFNYSPCSSNRFSSRFSPKVVGDIASKILSDYLTGKEWSGESDEEALWTEAITDQVKAAVKSTYPPCACNLLCKYSTLYGFLLDLNYPRYKIVVQTAIGQKKAQGVRVASRGLWDTETDNCATSYFENETIWATVMVFGLYTE